MRIVGMKEVRAFIAAASELERTSERGQATLEACMARYEELVAEGRAKDAAESRAAALALWQLEVIAIGARYEKAAVALLGEARRADESTEAYVFRTFAAGSDFKRMRAMQQANGLVYVT